MTASIDWTYTSETPVGPKTPVLVVEDLHVAYQTQKGPIPALRGVSFEIQRGETLGLVGESGCGKSTVAFALMNYLGINGKITSGSILFQGRDLKDRSAEELRHLWGDQIAMVYQDPLAALNPTLRIGEQLTEVLTVHRNMGQPAAVQRCLEILEKVNMPDPAGIMQRYPHQISGGQQQRVVIAMALLNNPALILMDEPTTGLDVTVEAAVLDLIADLRRAFDTAILYISHNLGVVARVADRVGVMYSGELVEQGPVEEIFLHPHHPYTKGLLNCIPRLGVSKESSLLYPIRGRVPRPNARPPGCVFEPRCDFAREECRQAHPDLREVAPMHTARCFFAEEVARTEFSQPFLSDLLGALRESQPPSNNNMKALLEVNDLKTYYVQSQQSLASIVGREPRKYVKAVDGLSFQLRPGQTLGIVGESGCGKSTLARCIMGLEGITGGSVEFLGVDVSHSVSQRGQNLLREMQMVFQNPDSSMNPSYTVGQAISRPLHLFGTVPRSQIREEVIRLLEAVKLDESYYDRMPRQISGGEKQRVAIARAIAGRPDLVLCDEPVSALDVSVQAAVLNLLIELQARHGTAMILISHDLSVVRYFSDYLAVMYLGHLVEVGPTESLFMPPYHPYTEALLSAVPVADPRIKQKHVRLEGTVPSAADPPTGCPFHTRCPRKIGLICETEEPPWRNAGAGHQIYCHIPLEDLRAVEPVVHVSPIAP